MNCEKNHDHYFLRQNGDINYPVQFLKSTKKFHGDILL